MKYNLFYIILFNILLIGAFSSNAHAGNFCKRGKYFHNASSSLCNGRSTNYCFSRSRGYHSCAGETPAPNVVSNGNDQTGEYCKRGRYFHFADSRACSNRSINYCHSRSRGYYECSEAQEVPATVAEVTPAIQPEAQAEATGEFCKRGKYFHRSSSGMCSGYAVNYCHSRSRGYHRCTGSTSPSVTTGGDVAFQSISCSSPSGKTPFQCMMCNCYHEARGEGPSGRLAVGKVVMTRARMRSYPDSVCGVVYDGQNNRYSQFSWTKSSNRHKTLARTGYNKCYPQVREALNFDGHFASHYHAKSVRPKWRRNCTGRTSIGNHYFYSDCGSQSRARTGMNVST